MLAFAGCTKDADVEALPVPATQNAKIVLTGISGQTTRTAFGEASQNAVPFLWSAGDCIRIGEQQSAAIAEGGSKASFVFETLAQAETYDVRYNMTGAAASTALIPAEQTQAAAGEPQLGPNGDFGYAATDADGCFTLAHATSYVWFDLYSSDVKSNLKSISLSVVEGISIAGEAVFADGALGACKGSSTVTLALGGDEGVALPAQSSSEVFAAMVLYPADLTDATVAIVCTFADGSAYLTSRSGKQLTAGGTLRISEQIAAADCKNDGVFFLHDAGYTEEVPEKVTALKAVTLGSGRLTAQHLTDIASRLQTDAVVDLGEADYEATEFPNAFYRKTLLKAVSLPRNILTFAAVTSATGAFYGCTGLQRATFPEGVTVIPQNCFRECTKLPAFEIPSTVTAVGSLAFYNCKLITEIEIPEGVEVLPDNTFAYCALLSSVKLPDTLTEIQRNAFYNCKGLKEITLPESVVTLGDYLFSGCSALKSVHLPDGLTAIPNRAFYSCSVLEELNMPSSLKSIGSYAFWNCYLLPDVTLPETLETIGEYSFYNCRSFTHIRLDIETVPAFAFYGSNMTSIELSEKVKTLGRAAFTMNYYLQSITCRATEVPDHDSSSYNSFNQAGTKVEGKKYLYVPAASYDAYQSEWADIIALGYTLEDINEQVLDEGIYYRTSRESDWTAALPSGSFSEFYIKTVGDDSIISQSALADIAERIAAQQNAVSVDLHAARYESDEFPALFAGNTKLGGIQCFDNTTGLVAGAFAGCTALSKAIVPAGVGSIGASTFEGCTALTSITVPASVTEVGDRAFADCAALGTLSLTNLKTIGEEAFAGSGLTEASLSSATIGQKAFRNCEALASLKLTSIATVPAGAFTGCTALAAVTLPATVTNVEAEAFEGCKSLTDLTLGSGVETIGDRAFADCGLTALVLPDNVTKLGSEAFAGNASMASISLGAGITAISDGAFATNDVIERLTVNKTVVSIGANAFADWSKLNTLTVSGNTLKSVGSRAFANAVSLATVYCEPTTVPAIAADGFSGAGEAVTGDRIVYVPDTEAYAAWAAACSNYTFKPFDENYLSEGIYYRTSADEKWTAELPASFATIYVKTAGDNTRLTAAGLAAVAAAVKALDAPATVDLSETLYESATFPNSFNANANLAGIVLPTNVTATAASAFAKTGLTSVRVQAGISYGASAFANCASLTEATVEEGVTAIGNNMFQNTKLARIALPNSVATIGQYSFQSCPLTSVDLGEGVTTVSRYAFWKCAELTEIYFPDATETVGQNAFAGCIKLAKVSFGKGMKTIEAYSFTGSSAMGGACPLLGDITCRSTTPPTLQNDYGTGPFGGSWYDHVGLDVQSENRVIHLPKSTDPATGTGVYADSTWAQLTTDDYGFHFVYDVE